MSVPTHGTAPSTGAGSAIAEPSLIAALVGAATLLFEISLTRVFSLAQGYHFAFLSVSLALLGNAAGGAAVAAGVWRRPLLQRPEVWCTSAGLAMLGALATAAVLPVDTYALAWSWRQAGLFVLYICLLAVPFVLAGTCLAICFERRLLASNVYAANLIGSAIGALAAALLLPSLGPVRCIGLAAAVSALSLAALTGPRPIVALLAVAAVVLPWDVLAMPRLSPYKPLWQALHAQGAERLASYWSRQGRIDVIGGPNLRMAGGVSLECAHGVPAQRMVYVDGESPSPILEIESPEQARFVECLPAWAAVRLREAQSALILEPTGDVPLFLALTALPGEVTAALPDEGVRAALQNERWGSEALASPRLALLGDNPRALLQRQSTWDLIYLPLSGAYLPVGWGAASLGEDYSATVDALSAALASLTPSGVLVAESWLQQPPSEELRLWLTVIAALRRHGISDVSAHLMAARSMQTVVVAASLTPWSADEVAAFRLEADSLALDPVWVPGLLAEETNRHNVLPDDVYYQTFVAALRTDGGWAESYPFAVQPATDQRPFPDDYFKWSQTGRIVSQVGKVALPMGGLGFLLLPLTLAVLALLAAALLAPALVRVSSRPPAPVSLAFIGLGVGYMAVELPLMQQALLLLREVPSSMALVLTALLLGSGVAGALCDRYPSRVWLALPAVSAAVAMLAAGRLMAALLPAPGWLQAAVVFALAATVGFGLGGAFPILMRAQGHGAGQRAWSVAVNGAASVLASVLATAVAVLSGFGVTYAVALCAYAAVAGLALARGLSARR